jgi:hypothetical protein
MPIRFAQQYNQWHSIAWTHAFSRNGKQTMTPTSVDSPHESGPASGRARAWLPKGAKVSALVFAGVFAIYRLATFTPQPLDGPHTLRPVLNAWFDAFVRLHERPETAYENWRAWCLFALLIAPALGLLNFAREHRTLNLPDRVAKILCSRGLLFAALAATFVLCRYPTLIDYQLNPDEGEFLSAAHKLFYDGNYFHSVDCGSSGPLNIYPLMLPAILGISPDYASSRILVLLIALAAIYLFHRTIRLLAPDSVARIAILPLACALAVFENQNLVHYSSEQIPVLLISLALYIAVRVLRNPLAHPIPLFLLGFLTSAAFFAKMQSVPIVGSIGAVAVLYTYASGNARKRRQPPLLFLAGALPLQLLNAAVCLASGVWTNFWIGYIVSNQRYADMGSNFVTELPGLVAYFVKIPEVGYFLFTFLGIGASYAVQRFSADRAGGRTVLLRMAIASALVIGALMATLLHADAATISTWLVLIAVFVASMSFVFYEKGSFGNDPVRWFGLLSIVSIAAAVFSVYRPHRPFPHYLFFLFLPVAAAMAWMLIRRTRPGSAGDRPHSASFAFPLLFAALALTHATFLWGSLNPHRFRTTTATIRQPEGDFIRSLTSANGRIFVWGWTADPYLGSGHVTATRDLNLFYQFLAPEEITSYYRARLLNDLSHHPPELIVDAIGHDSWFFDDNAAYGLAQVPEIASFVSHFYRHVADAYGERFFLRLDLAARADSVEMPKSCAPAAVRCAPYPRRLYPDGTSELVMENLPAVEMPEHALVEVQFTPFGRQTDNATILNNEAVPHSFRGFRFQNMGGDRYRLLLGLGERWAFSKPILLADGKPVWLSVEFAGTEVRIQANGAMVDTMHLPAPMAGSPGPITVGSWIDGVCRFSGTIQFFQIVDLGKTQQPPG